MKKVFIKTYGCQMNVHETEKLYLNFEESGYIECQSEEDADVIVFNTCAVRENAETHVYGNLGIIKKIKEKKPELMVAVIGCMSQQSGMADYLHRRCPFINVIMGTTGFDRLPGLLKNLSPSDYFCDTKINEIVPAGTNRAKRSGQNCFVNIMYGCNNFCTYCIVPYVKGRERSRKADDIYKEVKELISSGYKEITLLGQNVNSYNDGNYDFYALLDKISDIEGDYWIKFMTSHPKDLSEDVIKLIAKKEHLAKYIHLPLQSASDRILKLMNRNYDFKTYMNLIELIRKYIPEAGLSSDIIIGFPGESEEDFLLTLNAVEKICYNNLFMFLYSKRSGTPAAIMENQIPEDVKKERISRLIKVQARNAEKLAKESIGKTELVLCDSITDGICAGKTTSDKVIMFDGCRELVNKFVKVRITKNKNSKLYGELIK